MSTPARIDSLAARCISSGAAISSSGAMGSTSGVAFDNACGTDCVGVVVIKPPGFHSCKAASGLRSRAFRSDDAVDDAPRLHAAGIDVERQQPAPWILQQIALLRLEHLK